ncbi:valine-tRNA ligase [Thalictrum thalictroides]|uniref:Valine-tRNA ligase n=1 Tax=Thalictrum thalictroides TaxID=46969 RepID=A0A7J6X3S7_THATH|nr:valine-tRNA ligase [Thalictrum thalictroides]
MIRSPMKSRNCFVYILLLYSICLISGVFSLGSVTLERIEIFTTHDWLKYTPTVYFRCQGENKKMLPDVKKKNIVYTFKGEESWQPLTELTDKKCKRCGFYEEDTVGSDDVFDEWEFCPSDFMPPKGRYIRFKGNEFNATFLCPQCKGTAHSSEVPEEKKNNVTVVIIISSIFSVVCIFGAVVGYKYWKRRKREQDQARFLKLFEDGDDIEDEFGLDHM